MRKSRAHLASTLGLLKLQTMGLYPANKDTASPSFAGVAVPTVPLALASIGQSPMIETQVIS